MRPKRLYRPSPSGDTEDPDRYRWGGLHPVQIGDQLSESRYKIVHKLGFGSFSTNWLARDQHKDRYVSIKMCWALEPESSNEVKVLRHLNEHSLPGHPGRPFIMQLLDDFIVEGINGRHRCYVTQVAGQRLTPGENTDPSDTDNCINTSRQLLQGLAYLNACGVGHGDMYTSNILFQLQGLDDWSVEKLYEHMGVPILEPVVSLETPECPDEAPPYCVRRADLAALERVAGTNKVFIVDFGQGFFLEKPPTTVTTPAQFSAPERLFETPITPTLDIWCLACTIFELFAGYSLFKMVFDGKNDVRKDIVSMLGKPPDTMWLNWPERFVWFHEDGSPKLGLHDEIEANRYTLTERITDIDCVSQCPRNEQLEGHEVNGTVVRNHRQDVLVALQDMLEKMLRYDGDSRASAEELLSCPLFAPVYSPNL